MKSTLKTSKLSLLIFFLFWTLNCLKAQYGISAQMSTMPPYSTFLSDYATGNNLQLFLIQRDITRESQEVYLNIELEGAGIRLKTLPSFRPSTYIDIIPGQSLMLTNSDLAEYFNVNTLSFEGIGRESFLANGQQLPEGFYKLKVRAFLKFTGSVASNEAIGMMGIQKGQPPIINYPTNNGKVPENPTQNFSINWTNRNPASFNQTNIPSYRIEMWEMLDASQDPNIIAQSNYPPILDDYTSFTSYAHGMNNTPLTAGKSYALRVQLLSPDGREIYNNNGYSQVIKFTYGDACNPPINLTATTDKRGIQVNWALTPSQVGYRLQYGRIDTAWSEADVLINRFSIEKTYPSAQYQMKVATLCSADRVSAYSPIVNIGTPPSDHNNQWGCGGDFPKIIITNLKKLPSLAVGDKFTSFDFDITVTRVIRNDSNSYAGEGKTPFNMLGGAMVVVYFDGIQINTDRQHINDSPVRFQQKPYVFSDKKVREFKESFEKTHDMFTGDDAAHPKEISVEVTIGTVTYDSTLKKIVINDTQGLTVQTLSSGKDYKITDKDGNVYLVSKDNKISKQPKATESTVQGGKPVKEGGDNTDGLYFREEQPILEFVAHPDQVWGFDAPSLNTMAKHGYEIISNHLENYYVPYKAIGASGTDKVKVKVYANPLEVDMKRIRFKTNWGVVVPHEYDSLKQEWTLTITAGLHRNDFAVLPFYGNGKDTICGKLNVMPLDRKQVNLVLVPLNGYDKTKINASQIETYLNKVYHQANISYSVSLDSPFSSASADLPISVEHGKLEGEYSKAQAQVILDYIDFHREEKENTLYLFFCKQASNSQIKGHTPVNRGFGFLFGENIDLRTLAHEVGHGYPLALDHVFMAENGTNLMDYTSGTNLCFLQWGGAHNPKLKIRFGQNSTVGLAIQDEGFFLAPDGTKFEIPKTSDGGNYRFWITKLVPNGPVLELVEQESLDNGIEPDNVYTFDAIASKFINAKDRSKNIETKQIKSFKEKYDVLGYSSTINSYCEEINVVSGTVDKPQIVSHRLLVFDNDKKFASFKDEHDDDLLWSSYELDRVASCIKKVYRTVTGANYELLGDNGFKLFNMQDGCPLLNKLSLSIHGGFTESGQFKGAYPIWTTKTGNKAPPTTPTLATTSDQIKDKYKNVSNSKVAGSKVSILENGILLTIDEKGNKTIENDPTKIQALKASIKSGNITVNAQVLVESKLVDGKVVHDVTFGLKSGITPQKTGFKPLSETERQSLQMEVKKKMEDFLKKSGSDNLATLQPKTTDPNAFETDGSKTIVKEASIIEMISGVTKTAGELLEKCAIPASVYDSKDAGYAKSIFNTSPFACGLGNGMVDELKSIPQLVLLATDIALKEEVRDALVQQFKALTPSKVGSALVGFGKQTLGTIAGSSDKDYHDKGKMTFELATLIFGGVAGKADDALKASDDAVTSFGTIASKIDDAAGSPYKIFIAQTKNLRKLFAQLNPSQIKADDLNKFVDRLNALPQGQARKDLFEALDASDVKLDELDGYIKAVEADPNKLTKEKWEEFRKESITKTVISFANEIDNALSRLRSRAKFELNNTGEYKIVGGHHPLAKKAFEGDLLYDYKKAFSVKPSELDRVSGITNVHLSITGQQNSLYTAWKHANPNTKLTVGVMSDIEIQAMKNVGIPEDVATGWVVKALEDLKIQGATGIKNIPWNGSN